MAGRILRTIAFLLAAACVLRVAPAWAIAYDGVVLQGLDKVTARVTTIKAQIGEVVKFGTLEIVARHCDKRPPEEPPESAAFLDIWENRPGEPSVSLFRGWMFASSPALNALEHPVYDIWVLDCAGNPVGAPAGQAFPAPAPAPPTTPTPIPNQ